MPWIRCCAGTGASSASSTRQASGGRGASAGAGRWSRSACCWRAARSRRPTSSCWWSTRPRAPPIRTPRLPARRTPGRGVIIVANKWDLMKERGPDFVKEFDEELRRQLKFLDYAPILHISALDGRARAEAARSDRPRRRLAPEARADAGAEPLRAEPSPPRTRRPAPAADTCACCTPRRPAWRRRRSCSSPTSRRSFTFRTSGSW